MRAAVVLVWRPKNFPAWKRRAETGAGPVPPPMAYDRSVAPYTAVHLASLLPAHWQVHVVHEMVRDVDLDMPVDVVFLSTMDFCAPHARWLGEQFRARGVLVVVGGLYPTLNPGYFAGAADAVVVGEAEPILEQLVADLERRQPAPLYRASAPADLSVMPPPRYELVEREFSVTMSYEATRGCPFACSFCVLSADAARTPYRRRPVATVIRDIRHTPAGWTWRQRKVVTFWDNNLGADRVYFRELCEALAPLRRAWATQTSIDTITPESARLMGRSGCRYLYIGLESLVEDSLRASNKRHNRVAEYRRRLRLLHDQGIIVMSIFLVGLDGDTKEYLDRLPALVDEVGVDVPVFSMPVPIEGTPFRRALAEAGRLLPGDLLDGSDGVHLVYRPQRLSPEQLETALAFCMTRSYATWRVARRIIRRLPGGYIPTLTAALSNHVYMRFERALAQSALARTRARGRWAARIEQRAVMS